MTGPINDVKIITTPWSSQRPEDLFAVENPATGGLIATVQGASSEGVNAAVAAAETVWRTSWRWISPRERGRLLLNCARLLREHADELARIESEEIGKPITQARLADMEACIGSFEMFGGLAGALPSQIQEQGPLLSLSTLEPFGVVGGIIPFNWPPIHTAGKSAPALAVGNTVVLKPPEQGPFTVMRIVELLNTVLPSGVLTVVPGLGSCGEALAGHPLVRVVSFTGAPATGMAVIRTVARNLTPTVMELGGKNALIIFEDADVDQAVRGAIEGAFFNQGEACTAASRILVHASLYDEVVARLTKAVFRLRVGDPADPATHVGPLVTERQRKRVLDYIEIGMGEGATLAVQASLPTDPRLAGGFWVAPTLFIDVRPDMRIAREEIFGPVTAVIRFESYEDAIGIANGTDFGLMAGLYTNDFTKAWRASRELDVGVVLVNNYNRNFYGTPFGGGKHSGYGREHALETLRAYGHTKTVRVPTGLGKIQQWSALSDVLGPENY
ncbi:MAG: aldehyde dehydrogenase [Deltaproteobacteria bacterium]|nr:aldehyde dehydrogenase [Deltaproteobacteria bacterium]